MILQDDATKRFFAPLALESTDRLRVQLSPGKKDLLVLTVYSVVPTQAVPTRATPTRAVPTRAVQVVPTQPEYAGSRAAHVFFRRLPEGWQKTHSRWTAPATDYTVYLIRRLWSNDRLDMSEDAKLLMQYVLYRGLVGEKYAKVVAEFKRSGAVPDFDYVDNEALPLNPYQKVALYGALGSSGFGLMMDMGTGKTAVAIATICNRARRATATATATKFKTLVVCPKNVQLNWVEEVAKFDTIGLTASVLSGGAISRLHTLMEFLMSDTHAVLICSYDILRLDLAKLQAVKWDLCVLDESHSIKTFGAKRTKAALKIAECADSKLVLSGTPLSNSLADLYPQLEFLEPLGSGFSSHGAFKSFHIEASDYPVSMLERTKRVPFMQERLAKTCFFISKAEALPHLPDKVYGIREAEMSPVQSKAYAELANRLMIEITSDLKTANKSLVVSNVLTKLLRLAQITSGHIVYQINEPDQEARQSLEYFSPNPKLEMLIELLEEHDNKAIVWTSFTADVEAIRHRLTLEGVDHVVFTGKTNDADRKIALDRFANDDKCKVFVGNAAAGGVGLNLLGTENRPCDKVIYFSQGWSSVVRGQSEDRAHRIGCKKTVEIIDLVIPKTIDERIRTVVLEKRSSALTITDLKPLLEEMV